MNKKETLKSKVTYVVHLLAVQDKETNEKLKTDGLLKNSLCRRKTPKTELEKPPAHLSYPITLITR